MFKMKNMLFKYKMLPLEIKVAIYFLGCSFLEKGISIFTTPIFTRIMTAEEYGEFNIFSSWQNILSIFISLNLYGGVYSRGLVKNEKKRSEYSSTLQGLSFSIILIWGILIFILKEKISNLLGIPQLQLFMLLLIIWTNSCFGLWSGKKRIESKYKELIIITLLAIVLKPLLGVILILNLTNKVDARILSIVIVNIFLYSGLFLIQLREGKKFFSKKYWVDALKLNIPLIPHYLATSILSVSDRIMIGRLEGDDKAGIYSLAYSISMILLIFNSVVFQTLEPWLYLRLKENKVDQFHKIMYPALIGMGILSIFIIGFAPEIIIFFAPIEYYEAIWTIPPVTMSVFFMFSYTFFAVFEFYYEKTKYIVLSTFFAATLNILLNYIGITKFGYVIAGYITLFCYMIYSGMHFFFMRRICKDYMNGEKVYDTKILLKITIIFIILSIIILLTYKNYILRYFILLILTIYIIINLEKIKRYILELIHIKNYKKEKENE